MNPIEREMKEVNYKLIEEYVAVYNRLSAKMESGRPLHQEEKEEQHYLAACVAGILLESKGYTNKTNDQGVLEWIKELDQEDQEAAAKYEEDIFSDDEKQLDRLINSGKLNEVVAGAILQTMEQLGYSSSEIRELLDLSEKDTFKFYSAEALRVKLRTYENVEI